MTTRGRSGRAGGALHGCSNVLRRLVAARSERRRGLVLCVRYFWSVGCNIRWFSWRSDCLHHPTLGLGGGNRAGCILSGLLCRRDVPTVIHVLRCAYGLGLRRINGLASGDVRQLKLRRSNSATTDRLQESSELLQTDRARLLHTSQKLSGRRITERAAVAQAVGRTHGGPDALKARDALGRGLTSCDSVATRFLRAARASVVGRGRCAGVGAGEAVRLAIGRGAVVDGCCRRRAEVAAVEAGRRVGGGVDAGHASRARSVLEASGCLCATTVLRAQDAGRISRIVRARHHDAAALTASATTSAGRGRTTSAATSTATARRCASRSGAPTATGGRGARTRATSARRRPVVGTSRRR